MQQALVCPDPIGATTPPPGAFGPGFAHDVEVPQEGPEALPAPDADVQSLFERMVRGEPGGVADFVAAIYRQMRQLARQQMARQRRDHTLQPTALVNEALARLLQHGDMPWNDRVHFLRAAGRAMANILIDHARARAAHKRQAHGPRVELDSLVDLFERDGTDLTAIGEALQRLEAHDAQLAEVVRLRFFSGHTLEDTARILGISDRQVSRLWLVARGWLRNELGDD